MFCCGYIKKKMLQKIIFKKTREPRFHVMKFRRE